MHHNLPYQFVQRDGIQFRDISILPDGLTPLGILENGLLMLPPIKQNDTRIANSNMLTFEGVLSGVGDHVLYKKREIMGGCFLYTFGFGDSQARSVPASGFLQIPPRNGHPAFGCILPTAGGFGSFNRYKREPPGAQKNPQPFGGGLGMEHTGFEPVTSTMRM